MRSPAALPPGATDLDATIGGMDFEPVTPLGGGPATLPAPERVAPDNVSGTAWVTITDEGAQVLVHDFLPHRAIERLIKARRLAERDQTVLFDAVESVLDRVLVDRASFEEWVDDPANRVDSARYFDVFNRIVKFYLPDVDEGKATTDRGRS